MRRVVRARRSSSWPSPRCAATRATWRGWPSRSSGMRRAGARASRSTRRTGRGRCSATASATSARRWRQRGRPRSTRTRCGRSAYGAVELIEAAARTGATETAAAHLERLAIATQASGTPFALGMEAAVPGAPQRGRGRRPALPRGDRRARRARACAWSSPARTCSTASGCAASAGGWRRASSCARRRTCSRTWGSRRSPRGPGTSCARPARRPAAAGPRRAPG